MDEVNKKLAAIRGGLNDQFLGILLSGATQTAVKTGPGFIHSIFYGNPSSPTLTLYDMASGASGTILAQFGQSVPIGDYLLDIPFTLGCTAVFQIAAGAQPTTTISYK